MAWTYMQQNGWLMDPNGKQFAIGYAGFPPNGKNNPLMQTVKGIGPLPVGRYRITAPVDTTRHGPFVLRLEPDMANEMYGRAGFAIHGDSHTQPGEASHGCIVMNKVVRAMIWQSGDRDLLVVV